MWQANMRHFLETIVVIVLGLALWLALQGWIPPMSHGRARVSATQQDFSRFSLRTVFVVLTLAALMLALGVWLVR
jgi:hypothetical protein